MVHSVIDVAPTLVVPYFIAPLDVVKLGQDLHDISEFL